MKKFGLLFLSVFLVSLSFAQLKESAEIDKIFAAWNNQTSPGCALGIIQDGALVYGRGYGMANLEYDIPNSTKSVFRIGSTSKQFTAACIVLLAEQGKLSLDQSLDEFFPEFPAYASKIKVQHLLNHTSGIRDYLQLAYLKGYGDDDYYENEDIMEWLIHQSDLNFEPGEEFLYSNSGYWILGQIVGVAAGMDMAKFAYQEIFKPLKMVDTHFHNDHNRIVKNRASGYLPNENGFEICMTTLDMIGDGGIFTTINDIKKWDDAFYNSEVLSPKFWETMTTHGVLNSGEQIDYACGLDVSEYKGLKTISHGGAFVGFRAELFRFPEQRLTIAIFTNRGDANPTRMAYQIADILLKDKFIIEKVETAEVVEIPAPKVEFSLDQVSGTYELEPGMDLSISANEEGLMAEQGWNGSIYPIVKIKGNTFQIPGEESLSFTFSDLQDDFTQVLSIVQDGRTTITNRKAEVDMSTVDLNELVGDFYSAEMDVTYHIVMENNRLIMGIGKNPKSELLYAEADVFSSAVGTINFKRNAGKIDGFLLDSGRVINLKFQKK